MHQTPHSPTDVIVEHYQVIRTLTLLLCLKSWFGCFLMTRGVITQTSWADLLAVTVHQGGVRCWWNHKESYPPADAAMFSEKMHKNVTLKSSTLLQSDALLLRGEKLQRIKSETRKTEQSVHWCWLLRDYGKKLNIKKNVYCLMLYVML